MVRACQRFLEIAFIGVTDNRRVEFLFHLAGSTGFKDV